MVKESERLLDAISRLSSSERDLLSIISKTDLLTEVMLKDPQFSDDALRDLTSLLALHLVSVEISPLGMNLEHPAGISEFLHLHFLSLDENRRRHVAIVIAHSYLERKLVVKALQILVYSGDREALTEALMNNVLDVHTSESIEVILEITDLMMTDTEIRKFAQLAFKATCHIWRGEYLHALQKLEQIGTVLEDTQAPSYMQVTLEMLTGVTNYFMGNFNIAANQFRNTIESNIAHQYMSSAHLILVARYYASIGLHSMDAEIVQYAFDAAMRHRQDSYSLFTIYNHVQIQAIKAFVEGDLFLAFEKSAAALEIADGGHFLGTQAPFDALFIRASYLEENINRFEAKECWKRLKDLSERFNSPIYYLISALRLIRYQNYQNRLVAYQDSILEIRHYISSLPYSSELQGTVDYEEVELLIEAQDFERANSLIQRIPDSPRREILECLHIEQGLSLVSESFKAESTPRKEIACLFAQMKDSSLSDVMIFEIGKELIKIARKYGYIRTLCNQDWKLVSIILRASQESNDTTGEIMSRKLREFAKFSYLGSERAKLTSREMEILDLLNIGFGRMEICENLQIALNTFKTHQKHLYKKLNARNREEALLSAKKLGLISR